MKYYIILLFSVLLIAGCSKNGSSWSSKEANKSLRELTLSAISGNKQANTILSGLINTDLPVDKNYNALVIDSFKVNNNKYFYILLDYPNPFYNRFAVYDKQKNLLLLDKSLNGDLSVDMFNKDGMYFIKLVESFLSKDIISVKRLSIYKVEAGGVNLAMRTFYSMNRPDAFISQEITGITKDTITTSISAPGKLTDQTGDVFIFSPSKGRYLSSSNIVDNLVKQQIRDFNMETNLPQITDEKSARRIAEELSGK